MGTELQDILDKCDRLTAEEMEMTRNQNSRCGTLSKDKQEKQDFLKRLPMKRFEDGTIVPLRPTETIWYQIYLENSMVENRRFQKKFRRRFRMSYQSFLIHLQEVKDHILFSRDGLQGRMRLATHRRVLSCCCWAPLDIWKGKDT